MPSYTYGLTNEKDIEEIVNLVNGYDFDDKISVMFKKNVIFVSPFYFILLFQNSKANNKGIVLDISGLNNDTQGHIHRFLTQYLDFNSFKVENKSEEYQFLDSFSYLVTTKYISDTLIYSKEYDNTYLPIININPSKERYKENQGNIERRKETYQAFVIDDNKHEESTYSRRIHDEIKNMFEALNFAQSEPEAIQPFVNLFAELVDNIRKHTDIQTNEQIDAHICFFYDKKLNSGDGAKQGSFQLIISDSCQMGFLDRYLVVLQEEIVRLTNAKVPKEALISFLNSINELKNGKFEKILQSLFGMDSISTEHQIPRLVMHFGIPMILKIIQCFLREDNPKIKQNAKIEVYLNSKLKSTLYKVEVQIGKTKIIPNITNLSNENKSLYLNGTHIIITLPFDIRYDYKKCNPQTMTASNFIIKNNDFAAIYKKTVFYEIQGEINKFLEIKLDDNIQIESRIIAIDYKKYITQDKKITFSEFIRDLYLYSYKSRLQAIVVYNVPSEEFNSHLKLLFEIIYFSNENKKYDQPLDIVFYDEASPRAMLIGGENREEFLALNHSIGNNIIKDMRGQDCNKNNDNLVTKTKSPLTYEIIANGDKHSILLPFELFKILDEKNPNDYYDIFKDMVENFLEKKALKDINIDTQRGKYTDKYYQFKMLFQNSAWTKRIAFKLAYQLKGKSFDNIIGTDKYIAPIIAMLKSYDGFVNCDHEIIIPDINQTFKLGRFANKNVLVLSSVIFDGNLTNDKIYNNINAKEKEWYSIIDFKIQSNPTKSIVSLYVDIKDIKSLLPKKPLYRLRLDDSFEIDNFYLEDYKSKKFESYTEKENFIPQWIGSAYFGHVERGDNHYAFYTKTMQFYEKNIDEINKFLLNEVKDEVSSQDKVFILAPLHCTNNSFVTAVNSKVFDNDATVISLDRSKGEVNYHISSSEFNKYKKDTTIKIYFVDDEIASASTLQYYYLWIQRYFGEQKSFDGIITLIDRCSCESEMIIRHYLINDKKDRFYSFTALQIKPMKTIGSEECFLCKRAEEYEKLLGLSALDLTRFKFAGKIVKLKLKKAEEVDSDTEKKDKDNYYTQIKDFIKMYAVHYIYKNFTKFTDSNEYDNNLKDFQELVYLYILESECKDIHDEEKRILEAILNHESEVAIIKALSFPKLAYYKSIRETITDILHSKIKSILNHHITPKENMREELICKKIIDKETYCSKNEYLNALIYEYCDKSNLNMINLYFSVLGYLRDPFLLEAECLGLYAAMIKLTKENKQDIKHGYPTAVKIVIADDRKLAEYFYHQRNVMCNHFSDNKTAKHLYDAMLIENNITTREIKEINTLDGFMFEIKQILKRLKINIVIELKALYINELLNYDGDYEKYLEFEDGLIDIYDKKMQVSDSIIDKMKELYYGSVSSNTKPEDMKTLRKMPEDLSKINDTWANYYDKDTNTTIIKIVDTDVEKLRYADQKNIRHNKPIWFKPIGCIVIEHKEPLNDDLSQHILVVNAVLANQKALIEYIKEQATPIAMKARDATKEIGYKTRVMNNVSHTYKDYINIKDIIETKQKEINHAELLQQIGSYTLGLQYLFALGSMIIQNNKNTVRNCGIALHSENNFREELQNFSISFKSFFPKTPQYEITFDVNDDFEITLDDVERFKYIIFELVFNAMKQNKTQTDIINIDIIGIDKKLYICNTGHKIPNEKRDEIWKEGYSVKCYDQNGKPSGLGMGLSKIKQYFCEFDYDINVIDNIENYKNKYDVIMEIAKKEPKNDRAK